MKKLQTTVPQSTTLLAFTALLLTPHGFAQDAKVLGKQSVIEQYEAPVVESEPAELIDFPQMINAPGANDDLEILPTVSGLIIEFVGSENTAHTATSFLRFTNGSKTQEGQQTLINKLEDTLNVYKDLQLSLGDIRFIQKDITRVYAELGYPLMSVVVPPQEVINQQLRIQINEFGLSGYTVLFGSGDGKYSTDNSHWSNEAKINNTLKGLLDEPVLSKAALNKKIKRLNSNPFRTAKLVFEPGAKIGDTKANIQIDEKKLYSIKAGYNNHATESSGTDRYSVGGSFGNVFMEGHQLSWNAVIGRDIDAFENYSLVYTVPTQRGHTLTINSNYSDTASSSIPGISSASTTLQSTIAYQIPSYSSEKMQLKTKVSGHLKQFERASLFGAVQVGGAEFDAVQFALDNTLSIKEKLASNQFSLSVVVSLEGVTGANSNDNFSQFYNNPTAKADYSHYVLNYARNQQLSGLGEAWQGHSLETQISVQYTDAVLGGSDNFSIGGASVLRAYQASEVSGDEGYYITQSFHAKPIKGERLGVFSGFVSQISPSVFVEYGEGSFKNGTKEDLYDIGVQFRLAFKKNASCNVSYAVAGVDTARTDRGDGQFLASCNINYGFDKPWASSNQKAAPAPVK